MSISIHFEIINLDTAITKIDYLYKVYNLYIAFSQNYILFIDIITKKIILELFYKIIELDKINLCTFNDKIILQNINSLHSYYDIFSLEGKKLTNTPVNCKTNYLITFNGILYTLSICKNILYIIEPNDKIKCRIQLNFNIVWNSNPITYNNGTNDHIIILVKNLNNLYLILDINNHNTNISNEFSIDHEILIEQITIGYNNGLEIYMPYNSKKIIIGKIENLNYVGFIQNKFINGNFVEINFTKTYKNTKQFSDILIDLKGNHKLPVYYIDPFQWQINNQYSLEPIIAKSVIINKIAGNEPIVLSCISSKYMDFLEFIINNIDNNFDTMYFYASNKYTIVYSNIISATYIPEAFSEVIILDISSDGVTNYLFTTHSIVLSDNSLSKRYFPISLYQKKILDNDIYFKNIPNDITKSSFINKTIDLFTKLDIITIKLDFALSPYYKISSDIIKNLGIEYFTNIKSYLLLDIELQTNLYLLWNTLINPTFNTQ